MTDRILRRPEVETRTGLSRSTIYLLTSQGEFPKPLKLSARAVGWPESTVATWLAGRVSAV